MGMMVNSHRFGGGGSAAALGHYSLDDNDYFQMTLASFANPHTQAIWFKAPGTTLITNFMSVHGSANPDLSRNVYALYCSTNQVKYLVIDSTGAIARSAVDTSTFTANTWHLAIGSAPDANSRDAVLNAVTGGSDSGTAGFSGIDRWRIGVMTGGMANGPVKVAHAAMWDKVLSGAEMTELLTKAPNLVAPANLTHYAPLNDGTATDEITSTSLTSNGTPTSDVTDGPTLLT